MTDWLGRHDVDVENMWTFKDIATIFDELKEGHSMFLEDETGTVSLCVCLDSMSASSNLCIQINICAL